MRAPQKGGRSERRPRLNVVRSELRVRESSMARERGRRVPAHPLEFDERGFPIDQRPLTVAGRLGRFGTA